ncbi:hypothetical protein SKAU_G00324280 [Synaphobranchus kaupii]|uniref:Potassium channel inwardly rectifying transmembrane domain-containing protein n=1 Tax=Synaphobranchus kaupii TaxID=118154 RepID=A0A9Q1EP97_SYNKA|nr:hypothetical protein SKAU_G00324280 [Synaphobranchus kaupii]
MREARLAQVEGRQSSDGIPPSGVVCPTQEPRHKRKRGSPYEAAGVPPAKEKKRLSVQVASLTSEIEQLKAYLHSLAPPKPVHSSALSSTPPDVMGDELEDPYYHDVDMLSTQASNRDFPEHEETPRSEISDLPSATLEPSSVNAKDGSGSSRQGSEQSDPGQSPSSLCTILRTALARVGLDDAQPSRQQGAHPPPRLRHVLAHNQNPDRQCYRLPSPRGALVLNSAPPNPKSNGARVNEGSGPAVGRRVIEANSESLHQSEPGDLQHIAAIYFPQCTSPLVENVPVHAEAHPRPPGGAQNPPEPPGGQGWALQHRVWQHRVPQPLCFLKDFWTTFVEIRWRFMIFLFISSFTGSWFIFGLLWYWIAKRNGDLAGQSHVKGHVPCVSNVNGLTTAFLYSLETQTTIGYGGRRRNGPLRPGRSPSSSSSRSSAPSSTASCAASSWLRSHSPRRGPRRSPSARLR